MATFIFKRDRVQISLESLAAGALKDDFERLSKEIAGQLESLKCRTHHLEPVVLLQSEKDRVTCGGFGGCCRDFLVEIKDRVRLPESARSPDFEIVERISKYTRGG